MQGRKPKSQAHLKLVGRPGTPVRVRMTGGALDFPLGPPPEEWKPQAKALWHELAALIPPGVATKVDRLAFEVLCRLVARVRAKEELLTPSMAARVQSGMAAFGMTPVDRTRLVTPLTVQAAADEDAAAFFDGA